MSSILTYQLLAYAARAELRASHRLELAEKARRLPTWDRVAAEAESHGVAPLLYHHLRHLGIEPPAAARHQLQGLYLRHRRANQIRSQVLADVLRAFEAAGVQSRVLKGAALAHLVYPHPGLRAMRDVDILVEKSAAYDTQGLLAEMGFHAPLPDSAGLPDKHMAPAKKRVRGVTVSLEVHYNLFDSGYPASAELKDLTGAPLTFVPVAEGPTAFTLSHEEMLWHVSEHMVMNATVFDPTRLIWMADIVSYAEHFAAEIDWAWLKAHRPLVGNTLALLHFMTPLSEQLIELAALKIGHRPKGIGVDFQGWPRASLAQLRPQGYGKILQATFWPSEWWLRLHHGLGSRRSLFWYRWVHHPLEILGWLRQLLFERYGLDR